MFVPLRIARWHDVQRASRNNREPFNPSGEKSKCIVASYMGFVALNRTTSRMMKLMTASTTKAPNMPNMSFSPVFNAFLAMVSVTVSREIDRGLRPIKFGSTPLVHSTYVRRLILQANAFASYTSSRELSKKKAGLSPCLFTTNTNKLMPLLRHAQIAHRSTVGIC